MIETGKSTLGAAEESGLMLKSLGVVPRILMATDGTLTHILEAYAAEPVYLVKLTHALVAEPSARSELGLDEQESALRRIILLKGTKSDVTFVYADSVVMLNRLPESVTKGLLETDTPIGKLLFSCRAETLRQMLHMGEERDATVAAHFNRDADEPLASRVYQILFKDRPVARITEKFPMRAFPETGI